jgi:lipoprotein-anchoring transpeptidase ErfK/SrfK
MGSGRRQLLGRLGVAAVLITGAGLAVALVSRSQGSRPPNRASLPAPGEAAFVVRHAAKLRAGEHASAWAPVRRAAAARRAPGRRSAAVARVAERTPEGTENIVQVLRRVQRGNRVWLEVRLPAGASGLRGWLPRGVLGGYGFVRTRLVVDRSRLRATLLRNGRPVLRTAVGVGTSGAPTPPGEFYVRNLLTRYASPAYGPIAFGTSARSDQLTDWPAGGFIGIHGTDRPGLLPGRVSHGCIRMRNGAIRRLARLMPIGTPVTIR